MSLAVWNVTTSGPIRLAHRGLPTEASLESWIERDPDMVEGGLRVIGRQVRLSCGIADLLGVDVQGRLTVLELKKHDVGRNALAQALGYAAELSLSSAEELTQVFARSRTTAASEARQELIDRWDDGSANEVRIILVGLEQDASLQKVADLFSKYGFPLTVVTYQSFETRDRQHILVRTLSDSESEPAAPQRRAQVTVDQLRATAHTTGMGEAFDTIFEAAESLGINARPYKRCVMFTPPTHAGRTLFTVYVGTKDLFQVYVAAAAFPEFYPVGQEQVEQHLGREGWHHLTMEGSKQFAQQLRELFNMISAGNTAQEDNSEN